MKNLQTQELSGPPLEHDEWVKAQAAAEAAEIEAKRPKPAVKAKPEKTEK